MNPNFKLMLVPICQLAAQRSRRDEALMVADAFRIAFEQQLRKRSEQFMLLAEANMLKFHHCKQEGKLVSAQHAELKDGNTSTYSVITRDDAVLT